MKKIQSLTELDGVLTSLPRGGYLVDTSVGYIQFGSPPETLKDTFFLPKGVPTTYVLPMEHFDPKHGMSVAEIEFPIYWNYFVKKKLTTIYINPDHIENMKIVLQEAVFGPKEIDLEKEVENPENYTVPDILSEMRFFAANRTLEDMVDIRELNPEGFSIGAVRINQNKNGSFDVYDGEEFLVNVPAKVNFKALFDLGTTLKEPFIPPKFGITCLGPSHGFDPTQNTSGFILWINKAGIMVDPPANSTLWLKDSNVNPKTIDSVILTHCHADHDSGTFQKILEETKITIYTTPTIMQSFLRKYSALTRIPAKTLMSMFHFFPIKLNTHFNIHGAIFSFYYSLHSIPTIAFHFSYRNKTFIYSSDHLNEPTILKELLDKGVVDQARYEHLLKFPWNYDIIYHEAGIPPLHTPVSYLNSLPPDVQKKITVYHIAEKDFPKDTQLTLAKFGIGETIYPEIEKHKHEEAYEILDVFSRIEVFKDLPPERLKDLLLIVNKERFEKGDYIIRKDTMGDKFYVIVSGNVNIGGITNAEDKVYATYEYFGEASLILDTPRKADVIAATSVEAFSIEKFSFLRLIQNTPVEENIRKIAKIRDGITWSIIKGNHLFKSMSSSQITQLESILNHKVLGKDTALAVENQPIENIYMIISGVVEELKNGEVLALHEKGAMVGEICRICGHETATRTYKTITECEVYEIKANDMMHFLNDNPGILMNLMFENGALQ